MLEKFKNGPLALIAVIAIELCCMYLGHLLRHIF